MSSPAQTSFPISSAWRRNLQLRLVSITFLISISVLSAVGFLLVNRVTTGLLETKQQSAIAEATAASLEVQRLLDASDSGLVAPNNTRLVDSVITALAVRSGSPGIYDALFLGDPELIGAPERGTELISQESIPVDLRTAVRESKRQAWVYAPLLYEVGESKPGIVIGSPVNIPRVGSYELYLLFPLD